MSDIILDTIVSGFNLSSINENFVTIQDVINTEMLHLVGSNNVMLQSIDMNSRSMFNLKNATLDTEPVPLGQLLDLVAGVSLDTTDASLITYTHTGVGAVQTTGQIKFEECVYVKDFGAVGDGTIVGGGTDDTAALNAAYAAAAVAGLPLYLGHGSYRFTSQLVWDQELSVIGIGRSDLAPLVRSNLIKDGTFTGIKITTSFGTTYENFALIGATGNGGDGLEIFKGERINVNTLLIQGMGNQGLTVRGGNLGRYDDIALLSNSGHGLSWASGSGPVGVTANSCVATNLDIRGNGGSSAFEWTAGDDNIIQATVQNNTNKGFNITGAGSRSNTFDFYFESNGADATIDTSVIGNEFNIRLGTITDNSTTKTNMIKEGNQGGVLRFSYKNLFTGGIRLEERDLSHTDPTPWQIREVGNASEHKITIDSEGSAAKPALIEIGQSAGNVVDVTLGGEVRPRSIVSTIVATMASGDTTPSVGGTNTLLTAGTTTITNFDDGVVGQVIRVKAKSIITVQDNAQVGLEGTTDFDMKVGDTLSLELFESGVWSQVGKMVRL